MIADPPELMSIIICNFNHGKYLEESIKSAIFQSYASVEVIVVDDGSTDNSRDIIEMWRPFLVKVIYKENGGQRSAYNEGFGCANGRYLIFLDADDVLHTDAVATVVSRFVDGVAKVHYRLRLIDEAGVAIGGSIPRRISSGDVRSKFKSFGWLHNAPPGSGNAYNKDAIKNIFPLPISEHDRHGADFFLIFGSTAFGSIAAVKQILGDYRVILSQGASENFIFGNAAQANREPGRQKNREKMLVNMLSKHVGYRGDLISFPTLKMIAGVNALFSVNMLHRFSLNFPIIKKLLIIFKVDQDRSIFEKCLLLGWMISITVLPKSLSKYPIKYACNIVSR